MTKERPPIEPTDGAIDRPDYAWVAVLSATLVMQMINAFLYYLTPRAGSGRCGGGRARDLVCGLLTAVGTLGSIAFMLVGTPFVVRLWAMRSPVARSKDCTQ